MHPTPLLLIYLFHGLPSKNEHINLSCHAKNYIFIVKNNEKIFVMHYKLQLLYFAQDIQNYASKHLNAEIEHCMFFIKLPNKIQIT